MTPVPPPPAATGQLGRAAGIGAVALASLVAIAVAGLFLVLIGVQRRDRLAAPERYRVPPALSRPSNPGTPWFSPRPTSAQRSHNTAR